MKTSTAKLPENITAASPDFTLSIGGERLDRLLAAGAYPLAMAYIDGDFNVSGDIVAAIRALRSRFRPGPLQKIRNTLFRFAPARLETWLQSRKRAARNIHFHYDLSNEFYNKFLDSRLVYSAALFEEPDWTLDRAQTAKLENVCRKLDLHRGDCFLDVGCGWGALPIYAAEHFGARAYGCTLSRNQYTYAVSAIESRGLENNVHILEADYRRLSGGFRKIASIGMFEHVGRHRLAAYFRAVSRLLEDDGLFLNSGIARPEPVHDDYETRFLRNEVFPGGELAHLSDISRYAENAGFEILNLENTGQHYGRTCREWVRRLQDNSTVCIALVGEKAYRTWLLYLSASAINFEDGQTASYQMLMARRGHLAR